MRALALAMVLLAPALAGCLDGDDGAPPSSGVDRARDGDGSGTTGTTPAPPRSNLTAGKRWHFHNYWGLSDNLTLFEGTVHLAVEATVGGSGPRVGAGAFVPRDGVIVPPETGRITVEVVWNGTLPARPLNVTYRAANMSDFADGGPVQPERATILVAEAMADAPHTGVSGWEFRLVAAPDERGLALANGSVHVKAVAWLGRPIIIDPPHRDGWAGQTIRELAEASFEGRAAKTAKGVFLANASGTRTGESVLALVPPNGTLVPEGAAVILVRVDWAPTAALPVAPGFVVRWREGQTATSGLAEPEKTGATFAVFRIPVDTKAVDSPYSGRSTWRLDVDLGDGSPPAFDGKVAATAWVAKDAGAEPPA